MIPEPREVIVTTRSFTHIYEYLQTLSWKIPKPWFWQFDFFQTDRCAFHFLLVADIVLLQEM